MQKTKAEQIEFWEKHKRYCLEQIQIIVPTKNCPEWSQQRELLDEIYRANEQIEKLNKLP